MKQIKNFEQFLNESTKDRFKYGYLDNDDALKFYLVKGGKVNTKDPEKNEFVAGWEDDSDPMTYILVRTAQYPHLYPDGVIIASSNSGITKKDYKMYLHDDGNKTTRLPKSGAQATLVSIAKGAKGIKKEFAEGTYAMLVVK